MIKLNEGQTIKDLGNSCSIFELDINVSEPQKR
jgi:hypothetical protein